MAFQFNLTEEEERKKQEEQEGQSLSQPGGVIGGGVSPEQPKPNAPSSSGRWTNLKQYLDANRDQAGQLGEKVAGGVAREADEASQRIEQTNRDFRKQVDDNTVTLNKSVLDSAVSDPTGFLKAQTPKPKDGGLPKLTSGIAEQKPIPEISLNNLRRNIAPLDEFKKMRDASYKGPNNLVDTNLYQPLQKEKAEADEAARLAGSEEGRTTLLNNQFGRADYTQGQKNLDQLFLQGGEGNRERFESAVQKANDLKNPYEQLLASAPQYAEQGKKTTEGTRASVLDAFMGEKGAIPSLKQSLEGRVGDLTKQKADERRQLSESFAEESLSPEHFKKLGLQEGMSRYGVDMINYLKSSADPNINSVASLEEAARDAAYAELIGRNPLLADASQAGSYDPKNANKFDLGAFMDARNTREAAYKDELDNTYVTLDNSSFTNRSNDRMRLNEAIDYMKPYYEQAKSYLEDLKRMGQRVGSHRSIDIYNNLIRQREDLDSRHGANQKLKRR